MEVWLEAIAGKKTVENSHLFHFDGKTLDLEQERIIIIVRTACGGRSGTRDYYYVLLVEVKSPTPSE